MSNTPPSRDRPALIQDTPERGVQSIDSATDRDDSAASRAAHAAESAGTSAAAASAGASTSQPTQLAAKDQLHESIISEDEESGEEEEEGHETLLQKLRQLMAGEQSLRAKGHRQQRPERPSKLRWYFANLRKGRLQGREAVLDSFDLEGIASYIRSGKVKKIICMCGAGISVNAGIPDFRSPGTGLYDNLAKYNLPSPEAVFELQYFRRNPKPFYMLSKELFPGKFKPTATHSFIRLLADKKLLKRCYTQNIDCLEREAGTPPDLIVAAHGNFDTARCIDCGNYTPIEAVKAAVLSGDPCYCDTCGGLVKPDIVFFGEGLPARFFKLAEKDFDDCDLLLIIGTSLVVQPFAGLIGHVDDDTPRLLINKESVSGGGGLFGGGGSLDFSSSNYRDARYLGDCDKGIWELCRLLGPQWTENLKGLVEQTAVVDWQKDVTDSKGDKANL